MIRTFKRSPFLFSWLLLCTLIAILKIHLVIQSEPFIHYDGSYYAEIARNVSEGKGLLTSNSDFDANFRELPRVSHIYPLWPIIGGIGSKLLPEYLEFSQKLQIINIGFWFGLSLLFFYLCQLIFNKPWFSLLASGVFCHSPIMWVYSKNTYSEPTALFFLLLGLTALVQARINTDKAYNLWPFIAGISFALSILARSQSVIAISIIFFFLIIWTIFKKISLENSIKIFSAFTVLIAAYIYDQMGIRGELFSWQKLLIFQAHVDPFPMPAIPHVAQISLWERSLNGIKTFWSFSEYGAVTNAGLTHYLVLVFPAIFIKKIRKNWRRILLHPATLLAMIGLAYSLSLIPMQMDLARTWLFSHRHGILIMWMGLFTLGGIYCYFLKYSNYSHKKVNLALFTILVISFSLSIIGKELHKSVDTGLNKKIIKNEISNNITAFSDSIGRPVKILSLAARPMVYYSGQAGYLFESRRDNWEEYLKLKIKLLNIDLFILSEYDYNDPYAQKNGYYHEIKKTPPAYLKLIKTGGKGKSWYGIYAIQKSQKEAL